MMEDDISKATSFFLFIFCQRIILWETARRSIVCFATKFEKCIMTRSIRSLPNVYSEYSELNPRFSRTVKMCRRKKGLREILQTIVIHVVKDAKPLEYFHTLFHHHALPSLTTLLYHDSDFGDSKLIWCSDFEPSHPLFHHHALPWPVTWLDVCQFRVGQRGKSRSAYLASRPLLTWTQCCPACQLRGWKSAGHCSLCIPACRQLLST